MKIGVAKRRLKAARDEDYMTQTLFGLLVVTHPGCLPVGAGAQLG